MSRWDDDRNIKWAGHVAGALALAVLVLGTWALLTAVVVSVVKWMW